MDWLKKYTFPTESSYKDLDAANHRYSLLVKRFLANGTTTAMYYGSLHLAPNKVLVDTIQRLGQRAVVGKVSMQACTTLPTCAPDRHLGGHGHTIECADSLLRRLYNVRKYRMMCSRSSVSGAGIGLVHIL